MPWYQKAYQNIAVSYDEEPCFRGVKKEVDFLTKITQDPPGNRVLDLGCGTGRHALELARRGYAVTAVDLSPDQIKRGQEKERILGGSPIRWICQDIRNLQLADRFDLVLCICQAGFGLMESRAEDLKILTKAYAHLEEGGIFCLTGMDPRYVADWAGFDPDLGLLRQKVLGVNDLEDVLEFEMEERFYQPLELQESLKSIGFRIKGFYGQDSGSFALTPLGERVLLEYWVVAEKPITKNSFP